MQLSDLLSAMENELGSEPHVMKLLSKLKEEAVFEHANNKNFAMKEGTIPAKYKLLISIAVSAGLGDSKCSETYARVARRKGIAVDEIMEALLITRFIKATTVMSAASKTMEFLIEDK